MGVAPTRTWPYPVAAFASASDIGFVAFYFARLLPRMVTDTSIRPDSERAKTPMISGIVTGSVIAAMWFAAFILYVFRRIRATRSAHAAGYNSRREVLRPPKKPEAFIIPPDPAVVVEGHVPGEATFPEEDERYRDDPEMEGRDVRKVKTEPEPASHAEIKKAHAHAHVHLWGGREKEKERERARGEGEDGEAHELITQQHRNSAPAGVVFSRHLSPIPDEPRGGPEDSPPMVHTPGTASNSSANGYASSNGTANGYDHEMVRQMVNFSEDHRDSRR